MSELQIKLSAQQRQLTRPAEAAWLDTRAYPFAPRSFRTPDGAVSYLDEGCGPVALFVHGTPSWSFEWRHVILKLRERWRCVAPDHLGFGLSDKPSRLQAEARDAVTGWCLLDPALHSRRLVALVEALDLRDVTLVVHDFGGPIGLGAALQLGERIGRIVVLNTWLWPNGDDPKLVKLGKAIDGPLGAFLYRWLNFSPRVLLPAMFGEGKKLTKEVRGQYLGPFARRAQREGPYAMARALLGSDRYYGELWAARERLAPKLTDLLWGEKDAAFKAVHLQRWTEAFPSARVTRLPGVGHFVAEEAPEALVRVLEPDSRRSLT